MPAQSEIRTLLETIKADPAVPDAIKKKAEDTLSAEPAYRTDVLIYRIVVIVLGLTVLLTVGGGFALAFLGSPEHYKIPPELIALGSAAVGALAGLLAPSPGQTKAT